MAFKAILALATLAATVVAAPAHRAACSNGRSASHEAVRLSVSAED